VKPYYGKEREETMTTEKGLVKATTGLPVGLQQAIVMWADATTRAESQRRRDLLRDKSRVLADFFSYAGKPPEMITAIDVKMWQAKLEGEGLAHSTIYARVSRVSSFFEWALSEESLGERIGGNPVKLARPKAPKAYQTESTQALDDDEVKALLAVVKAKADKGSLVGKRDYALLLFYLATGWRRAEVIGLRWKRVKVNGGLTITAREKGGDYKGRNIDDVRVKEALFDYLEASGRLDSMKPNTPLWTRHDRAGEPNGPLSSHAFVKNLKGYAETAGIGDIHLHQTRHTYGRWIAEESGSINEVQDALDHKSRSNTRIYVRRIAVKKDKYSKAILDRLDV
jgi:integrase